MQPVRLQLSRRKGFNLQALSQAANGLPAVNVARPGLFGNPFSVADARDTGIRSSDDALRSFVVDCFRDWLHGSNRMWMGEQSERRRAAIRDNLNKLRGRNLACWCPPGSPCHAGVLLELANRPTCEEVQR